METESCPSPFVKREWERTSRMKETDLQTNTVTASA